MFPVSHLQKNILRLCSHKQKKQTMKKMLLNAKVHLLIFFHAFALNSKGNKNEIIFSRKFLVDLLYSHLNSYAAQAVRYSQIMDRLLIPPIRLHCSKLLLHDSWFIIYLSASSEDGPSKEHMMNYACLTTVIWTILPSTRVNDVQRLICVDISPNRK